MAAISETTHDIATRISEGCGVNNQAAVKHLARSAALEEIICLYEAGDRGQTAATLFFVVRSLCNEFGLDYSLVVDSARRYAQQVERNNVNII